MTSNQGRLPRLRAVFMGTPAFAVPALDALADAGHNIVGVCTQPDRRSGRGRRVTVPPVKQAAMERGLPIFQPASLRRDDDARREIELLEPDLIVVAAYGLFLPAETLAAPPLGALNIHPSLLPKHRGPSPVATAILEGDATTGVTVMQLDEGMDSGPIVAQRETDIGDEETAEALTARLFDIGAELLADTIPLWQAGEISPKRQRESEATITKLLKREDGSIYWAGSAGYIARQVRAYYPWPGTFTHWNGKQLKIHEASVVAMDRTGEPGTVVEVPEGVAVVAGEGALLLLRVQMAGRQATGITDFARGYREFVGSRLGAS